MSDYLLSLETRDDLTAHVLQHTEAIKIFGSIRTYLLRDDSSYDFKARITALEKHWRSNQLLWKNHTPEEMLADRPIAPLKTELPDDKPAGWKLDLGETRAAEAQRQLELLNIQKHRCLKYWTTFKKPKPQWWSPADGEAWKKVSRADVENGDLFFTPYFQPSWESYALACMDVLNWTDPDNTPKEEAEYQEHMAEKHEIIELSLSMRQARKEYAQSLGIKGGF